jgi:energy-coupling factor transporter ATP-binding protein EcfA2
MRDTQDAAVERFAAFLRSDAHIYVLTGPAGSGKTHLVRRFADLAASADRRLSPIAPTGRAAQVLEHRTGLAARTVHSRIYSFDRLQVPTTRPESSVVFGQPSASPDRRTCLAHPLDRSPAIPTLTLTDASLGGSLKPEDLRALEYLFGFKNELNSRRENVHKRVHLKQVVGEAAIPGVLKFALAKPNGNKLYINEARRFFSPLQRDGRWSYCYLGHLGSKPWSPAPHVQR